MNKPITVALLRDLEKQVFNEEISYSRMVEILNEKFIEKIDEQIDYLQKKSSSEKGNIKKLYNSSVTSFVVFKMKLKEEL